jgi:hypothetical protein
MSHSSHSYEFFSKSLFSPPVVVAISCVKFDALSCLTPADADLCFAMDRCFVCRIAKHHVDICPQCCLGMLLCQQLDDVHHESMFALIDRDVDFLIKGWDAPGHVLNSIVCRESASKAELDRQSGWGHYIGEKDEWGVTEEEEKEVSVKVCSNLEDSKRSSACRCCVSLHSSGLIYWKQQLHWCFMMKLLVLLSPCLSCPSRRGRPVCYQSL